MLITTGGVLIRTRVSEIREMGRATQGVTLIAVEDGTKLSGLQRIVETDLEEVELESGAGVRMTVPQARRWKAESAFHHCWCRNGASSGGRRFLFGSRETAGTNVAATTSSPPPRGRR
jgi:hypothetical protein